VRRRQGHEGGGGQAAPPEQVGRLGRFAATRLTAKTSHAVPLQAIAVGTASWPVPPGREEASSPARLERYGRSRAGGPALPRPAGAHPYWRVRRMPVGLEVGSPSMAVAMRSTAVAKICRLVPMFSRTWPTPGRPKLGPELSATRPRARKAALGSSPSGSRQIASRHYAGSTPGRRRYRTRGWLACSPTLASGVRSRCCHACSPTTPGW
jgi:hypothetical protein